MIFVSIVVKTTKHGEEMSYSKSIIIISAKIYFLYKVYKNNHINSFINAQL